MNTFPMGALIPAAAVAMVASFGLRLNLSPSAPIGIWKAEAVEEIKRGDWVSVCPPSSPATTAMAAMKILPMGDCPGLNVAPLLKPVSAVAGDVVRLYSGRLVTVNGLPLPNTISTQVLPAWPDGEYTVQPWEVWLFSGYSENSFDSRYFGPVQIADVRSKAIPLMIEDT